MNDSKKGNQLNTNNTDMNFESASSADKEIQQVFSKPVNRSYRSTPINRIHEDNLISGVVVGEVFKVSDETGNQNIFVNYPNNPYTTPLLAMTTINLSSADAGKQVVLSFDQGNPLRPIITGVLQHNQPPVQELAIDVSRELSEKLLQAKLDGDQVTLTADKEIVLQCGKSSITLTRAGKVLIRGAYLLSRSSGVNKIKGGSVQLN